jgi:aryl-alcohol dehydrogenase-like predicted oxidoreductase
MIYGKVKGIDKPISRLVLGTMIINTRELDRSFELMDAAVELGCTTLDTAHVYAGGDSERTIGRWMEARGNRDNVVVLSKGAHHNADRKRVTPFDITADLHDSLTRLRSDYIDIYLLHRDDPDVPVGPIVECLNEHLENGLIRAIGGSNWTHQRIQEANEYAKSHGLVPFAASSPNFGLAEQVEDPWGPGCVSLSGPKEVEAQKWYEEKQMPVFAYSSLGRGFFSGRITRGNFQELKEKGAIDGACLRAYCHEQNFKRLDRVQIMAEEKGMSVPQIATAYIMNQPLNVFALVGAASGDEFKANVEACELKLIPEEVAWLDLRSDTR